MFERIRSRFSGLMSRSRILREAEAEIEFHIQMETEANRERGLSPKAARQAALREFGGVTQVRESVHAVRRTGIEGLWQDVRYGMRTLRRSPSFGVMAVLILGFGIGTTTAAFSIANTVFFRTLPVPDADRLGFVYQRLSNGMLHAGFGWESTQFFEGRYDRVFSGVAAHRACTRMVAIEGLEATQVRGECVTANYFNVIGVKPMMGRTFGPPDDEPSNADRAIVISHDLWAREFKKDPAILGRQIRVGDRVFGIVGVMAPAFRGLSDGWHPSRYWVPVAQLETWQPGQSWHLGTIVRLKPAVSLEEAQAAVNVLGPQLQLEAVRESQYARWKPTPLVVVRATAVQDPFRPDQWLVEPRLLAAIGIVAMMVLLIAITNIAGVVAARSIARAQEIAVRQALGASARQLVRQLLTEGVIVALLGGSLGLLLSRWLVGGYEAMVPTRFDVDISLDLRVVAFTFILCIGAGVLVSLAPAVQARRVCVTTALAGGPGVAGGRLARRRLRHVILLPQIILSTVLLVVAGVHVRALSAIERAQLGYTIDGVVVMNANHWDIPAPYSDQTKTAADKRNERNRAFYLALERQLTRVTEANVAIASTPHPLAFTMPGRFVSEPAVLAGLPEPTPAYALRISANYFDTLGIRLLEGRDFDARDTMTSPAVAIISQGLARRLFPAGNVVGQSIAWHMGGSERRHWWLRIIGVVAETSPVLRDAPEHSAVYLSFAQTWQPFSFYVVATGPGDATALVQELKSLIAGADDFAEVRDVRSMSEIVDEVLYPRRSAATMLVVCGLAGLVLAAAGIYGVISHSVAQRSQEIGIRTTLGASRRTIIALVLREAVRVSAAGVLPGVFLAWVALRMTANVVGPIPTFDAVAFVAVPFVALTVILAASYGPARRAARLDPMQVLRQS